METIRRTRLCGGLCQAWHANMKASGTTQFERSRWMRWIALSCIALALFMTGLEATHAHSDAVAQNSSPCVICISVHANAPAVTFHPLPTLAALETLSVPYQAEGKGIVKEISLFTRPPPAA